MGERNKHGLGRYVPSEVRRVVRQRCGFGCVICGLAFYDYEHFNPDFKDALTHEADGITLLCMQCNQKRARGMLSRETVARSNDNPKCKQSGYSSETFDFGIEPIEVIVAGNRFKNCRTLIHLGGCDILSVAPPLELGQPFRLSGVFSDETGACTLKIDDNVLVVGADNWDVESTGPRVVIRRGPGDIALSLYLEPPHRMTVERINMQYNGCYLRGGEDGLELSHDGKSWGRLYAISMENFEVGIYVG